MTLFDLQFKLCYMLNFLPFFLLVKWFVFAICLLHLLFDLLKHGWHLPNFFSFWIIGLLLCNLCLHSSCFKFLFPRNAMTGLSVNSGAIFELMDKVFQLSSISFLRLGRFLLYVTARMLGLFTGFVFVESNSLRGVWNTLLIWSCVNVLS